MNWSYIAGFFDGEGYCKKQGKYSVIQITQKDKGILEQIQHFIGYGHIYRKDKKLEYKGYDLRINKRKDCINFIKNIKLFSIVKKRNLEELEFSILEDMERRIKKTLGNNFVLTENKKIKQVLEE